MNMEAEGHELQKPRRNKTHGRTEFGDKLHEAIELYLLLRTISTHCESVFLCNVST